MPLDRSPGGASSVFRRARCLTRAPAPQRGQGPRVVIDKWDCGDRSRRHRVRRALPSRAERCTEGCTELCAVRRATSLACERPAIGEAMSSAAATLNVAAAAAVLIRNSRREAATQYPRAYARFIAVRE